MQPDLLPCANCCGKPELRQLYKEYSVICLECGQSSCLASAEMAIKLWNTRANKAENEENVIEIELRSSQVLAELIRWLDTEVYIRGNKSWNGEAFTEVLKKIKELQGE